MIYTIFTIWLPVLWERNIESVRMVNAVPFIHQPDHMALKVSDVSAAYWQHLTHNKTLQFYICTVMAFLSREILPVCI